MCPLGLLEPGSVASAEHPLVHLEVRIDHAVAAEAGHRILADSTTVERGGSADGKDGLVNIVDQEAGASVVDQLRHRPPTGGHYRRPAGHGLDNAEAEGLLEVDEMEEGISATEKGVAVLRAHWPM